MRRAAGIRDRRNQQLPYRKGSQKEATSTSAELTMVDHREAGAHTCDGTRAGGPAGRSGGRGEDGCLFGEELGQGDGRLAGDSLHGFGHLGRLRLAHQRRELEHVLDQPFRAAHREQRLTETSGGVG